MIAAGETLAKKGTWCPLCNRRIKRGEHYIRKVARLDRWAHSGCAKGYEAAMEENAALDCEEGR